MEFGAGVFKLPSWIPEYPGSKAEGTFLAKGDDGNGHGEGGMYTFTTKDEPSKVLQFYQDKGKDMGMKATMNSTLGDAGGMLILADDDQKRSLQVTIGKNQDGNGTTVSVIYGTKK
jgi:hypothetical protein